MEQIVTIGIAAMITIGTLGAGAQVAAVTAEVTAAEAAAAAGLGVEGAVGATAGSSLAGTTFGVSNLTLANSLVQFSNSLVMSGGDFRSAILGTVSSAVGGAVGSQVDSMVTEFLNTHSLVGLDTARLIGDSAGIFARLTAAGAITGGDPSEFLTRALLTAVAEAGLDAVDGNDVLRSTISRPRLEQRSHRPALDWPWEITRVRQPSPMFLGWPCRAGGDREMQRRAQQQCPPKQEPHQQWMKALGRFSLKFSRVMA